MEQKSTFRNIRRINKMHLKFVKRIGTRSSVSSRVMGVILALELKTSGETSYFNNLRDFAVNFFMKKGILLRPLGNVIYLVPPYCISDKDLNYIYDSIVEFLDSL